MLARRRPAAIFTTGGYLAIPVLLAARPLGIPPDGRVILVFGGSQAAARLNSAVFEVLPALVERWFVIHLTGDTGYAEALASRQRLPDGLRARYRAEPFLREGMVTALAAADLVVGRAGSSTLAEVTAFGLPMVVVPYRFAGGHQHANAEALVAAGAARIVEDEAFDGPALLAAATILDDPTTYATMSAAARGLGRPAAADAVAELLLALAKRVPLPSQEAVAALSRDGLA